MPVDLPSPPTFTKTNPNDQPIMYIAIVSDTATEGQLYDYANTQIGERISILPGVSQVAIYGTQSAVRIKADPSAMATRNITLEDLTNAVKNGTAYTGAGQFDGPHRSFLLQPQGQLTTADQYNGLIVGQSNGAPVYLKDVATAKQGVQDERIDMRVWVRGYPQPGANVFIGVFRRAGVNAVDVAKSVRDLLAIHSIATSRFSSACLRRMTARRPSSPASTTSRPRSTSPSCSWSWSSSSSLAAPPTRLIPAVALAPLAAADVRLR